RRGEGEGETAPRVAGPGRRGAGADPQGDERRGVSERESCCRRAHAKWSTPARGAETSLPRESRTRPPGLPLRIEPMRVTRTRALFPAASIFPRADAGAVNTSS